MKYFTTLLMLFSFTLQSHASTPRVWVTNDGSFLLSQDSVTNGEITLKGGMFGGHDLTPLVKDNSQALEFANLSNQYNTYAMITFWALAVPSMLVFVTGPLLQNINTPWTYYGSTLFWGSFGALFGSSFATSHFMSKSRHYKFEAINCYNWVTMQSAEPTIHTNFLSFSF